MTTALSPSDVLKYAEKNAASCSIPAEAVKNMQLAHGKSQSA